MYDARGSSSNSNNNAVFGIAIVGVIVAAFAAVLFWPSGGDASPELIAKSKNNGAEIHVAFENKAGRAVVASIAKLDPIAYQRIETSLAGGNIATTTRDEIVFQELLPILMANIDVLPNADVKHFDAILSDIRGGLRDASRSGSKYCKGNTFAAMVKMGQAKAERMLKQELMNNEDVRNFGFQMTHRFLEAISDAKKNPVKHSAITPSDERALQGVAMSLMTQPEFLMIGMAANSGGAGAEAALAKVDLCQLSVAALKAVDTLPAGTKGRLWAQTFSEISKQGGLNFDPRTMSGLAGF